MTGFGHIGVTRKKSMSDTQKKKKKAEKKTTIKVKIPSITIVPESTLVNFITLAESVALAPMVDLRTSSSDGLSTTTWEVDIFNLFILAIIVGFLVL